MKLNLQIQKILIQRKSWYLHSERNKVKKHVDRVSRFISRNWSKNMHENWKAQLESNWTPSINPYSKHLSSRYSTLNRSSQPSPSKGISIYSEPADFAKFITELNEKQYQNLEFLNSLSNKWKYMERPSSVAFDADSKNWQQNELKMTVKTTSTAHTSFRQSCMSGFNPSKSKYKDLSQSPNKPKV